MLIFSLIICAGYRRKQPYFTVFLEKIKNSGCTAMSDNHKNAKTESRMKYLNLLFCITILLAIGCKNTGSTVKAETVMQVVQDQKTEKTQKESKEP